MGDDFTKIIRKVRETSELNKDDLKTLLSAREEETGELFKLADELRKRYMGDKVELRAIIEITSYCRQDCLYCGMRRSNLSLRRCRLEPDAIHKTAQKAVKAGYKTIVIQGGEDPVLTAGSIARLVERIKLLGTAITLSLGEWDYHAYRLWREAGADRYLLKHETADGLLYSQLRPGRVLAERIECQHMLKDLGYQLGSGCMIGLPGQTVDSLAEDLLMVKRMNAGMAAFGPFIPHPRTPLAKKKKGSPDMSLKVVAAARLILPHVHLPATTALDSIVQGGRKAALMAGANVLMPNISPGIIKKSYQIYPKMFSPIDEDALSLQKTTKMIEDMGFAISKDYGHCHEPVKR